MNIDHDFIRLLYKITNKVADAVKDGHVLIAGGCLRDMLLDKPIKDIDVFYNGTLDDDKLDMETVEDDGSKEEYDSDFHVHPTLNMEGCLYPIQLIKVEEPNLQTWIMEKFGCNLSKVILGTNGIFLTQEFLDDVEMEILTFPNPVDQKYMDKMTTKYPDFLVNGMVK